MLYLNAVALVYIPLCPTNDVSGSKKKRRSSVTPAELFGQCMTSEVVTLRDRVAKHPIMCAGVDSTNILLDNLYFLGPRRFFGPCPLTSR